MISRFAICRPGRMSEPLPARNLGLDILRSLAIGPAPSAAMYRWSILRFRDRLTG